MNQLAFFVVLFIMLGSVQGLILSFVLARIKLFNKVSNFYLAVFILAFSLSNLHYVAHILGIMIQYSWLNYLTFPWTFLIPIVFYFFIVYLLNPAHKLTNGERWLFLPFVFQVVFHIVLFFFDFFDSSILKQYENLIFLIDIKIETVLSLLLNLIFIPLVFKRLSSYEEKLKANYSEISHSSVSWLKRLVLALIGIWILWALPALYQVFTGITTPLLDLILWVLMSVCIYWIGYATYFRRDIFLAERSFPSTLPLEQTKTTPENSQLNDNTKSREPEKLSSSNQPISKRKNPTITKKIAKLEQHYNRLIDILEVEKLYTDQDFNLSMLSDKCSLSPNYLSQIISKKTDGNFYTLINRYRVEEAKRLMGSNDHAHYTLVSIGLEAGFKSKSSFYKIFKERTNQTPSQFQKSIN